MYLSNKSVGEGEKQMDNNIPNTQDRESFKNIESSAFENSIGGNHNNYNCLGNNINANNTINVFIIMAKDTEEETVEQIKTLIEKYGGTIKEQKNEDRCSNN